MRLSEIAPPSRLRWATLLVLLIVFGLSIPKVVSLAAIVIIVIALLSRALAGFNLAYFWRIYLLALFSLLYYSTLIFHRHAPFFDVIKMPAIFVGMYLAGYTMVRSPTRQDTRHLPWLLIAPAIGFVIYGVGSVVYTGFPLQFSYLPGAKSLWSDGAVLHKTVIGVFCSMGMCLLPAVFASRQGSKFENRLWSIVCLLMVVLAFAGNFAVQNRTPLIAVGIASLIGFWILIAGAAGGGFDIARVLRWMVALAFTVGSFVLAIEYYFPLLMDTLFNRFQVMGGLESTRFDVWSTMLLHLFDHPFGGRKIVLTENFAHNVWLDVVFDAGFPVALLLLVFHLSHIPAVVRCIARADDVRLRVVITSTTTSLAISFFVEPILWASAYVFAASCFILGAVLRISHDLSGVQTYARSNSNVPDAQGTHGVRLA